MLVFVTQSTQPSAFMKHITSQFVNGLRPSREKISITLAGGQRAAARDPRNTAKLTLSLAQPQPIVELQSLKVLDSRPTQGPSIHN